MLYLVPRLRCVHCTVFVLPPSGTCVAKNSQRPVSVETVQGGVPPYGVKETLVVNGKKIAVIMAGTSFW